MCRIETGAHGIDALSRDAEKPKRTRRWSSRDDQSAGWSGTAVMACLWCARRAVAFVVISIGCLGHLKYKVHFPPISAFQADAQAGT
jgi:hypothetical protein